MRFWFKLFLGSAGSAVIGIWWLIDGIFDGPMNEILGGLWWKGTLLLVVGAVGAVMGFRMMKEVVEEYTQEPNQSTPPTSSPRQDGLDSGQK